MSYQVLARKWRPKSFEELVGQNHVAQTLINALRSGRLPQALLFSGARGVGKTSSARIFAKSLRCPNSKDYIPCNQCTTCDEVAQGRHLDVIEIDGASNNGVDAIRELRDSVGFMPSSGRHKVYIIDEVHMLSTNAFNALLKTLEEPPPHVVFIFATTEPQKIPVTILSRCQRFDFRRIPTRQIVERLDLICKAENVQFEPEALWTIARQSEGALRDSQSLLDQAITFCSGNITQSQVTAVLGLTDRRLLYQTLSALVGRDLQLCLDVLEKIYSGGFDPGVFVQDFLELVRHAVMVRTQPKDIHALVDLADSEIEELKNLTQALSPEDMHLIFDMTLKGANDLVRSLNPRVVLEMLLLRMAQAPRIVEISQLLGRPQGPDQPTATRPIPAAKTSQARTTPDSTVNRTYSAPTPTVSPAAQPVSAPPADMTPLKDKSWDQFVARLRPVAPQIAAKLEYVAVLENSPQIIRLGVKERLMQDQISEKANLQKIKNFLKTFWGFEGEVSVELMKNDLSQPDQAPLSLKEQAARSSQQAQDSLMKQVEQHPLVKQTQSTFKTKISSIKEQS